MTDNDNLAVQGATTDRALKLVSESWERDNLSVIEMISHLDALCDIADGLTTFSEFTEEAKLIGQERLI